jgi:hypothetical protein
MGASSPDSATQVWDLADWVKPYSGALLDYTFNTLLPTNLYTYQQGGKFYAKQSDLDRVKATNPGAYDAWSKDVLALPENFDYRDASPGIRTWGSAGGPPDQPYEDFSDVEKYGQNAALGVVGGGNPLQQYARQFAANRFNGGEQSLADQQLAYFLGGPLAGATRTGMLDELTGSGAQYSEQALLDTLYGRSAAAGDQALYTLLGSDREATREGMHRTIGGPEAEQARRTAAKTMRGDYLSPESNPYLEDTYRRAAGAMTDQYRDAVAPQITAQFARAGSFGGSAHQNTEAAARYNYVRNLEELATGIYGENYGRERDRQLQVAGQERGFTENALTNRLAQEVGAASGLVGQRASAAEAERAGRRQVLTGERGLQGQMTEGTLARLMQLTGMVPGIRAADYQDADVIRTIGREQTELGRTNREIQQANALADFQFPFDIIGLLSGGIGGAIGNSGTSTSSKDVGTGNAAAQATGGGLALLSLLSGLSS